MRSWGAGFMRAGRSLARSPNGRVPTAGAPKPQRVSGPGRSVVRVVAGGAADAVAVEAAPGQQIGRLATLGERFRPGRAEPAADQLPGVIGPIALEGVHGRGDLLAVQPVGAQFGADVDRPVAGIGADADQ